jgi:hypothetical protein
MAKKEVPAPVVTQVNTWDQQLADAAAEVSSMEAGSSNFISTRNGILSYNGTPIPGNKLNVVVINHAMENHYYTERFDPDSPASPVCFAFGTDESTMAPHELSSEPQAEKCASCPRNQFGSADTGKGKACKNIRRLGVITEDDLEDVKAAALAVIKIPVTSVKPWKAYVQSLNNTLRRPPFSVVTQIAPVPHPKHQFELTFKLDAQITDGSDLQAIMDRRDAAMEELCSPYAPPVAQDDTAEQPQKPQGRRKF